MALAKRADELGYLPPTIDEWKPSLPKGKQKTVKLTDLSKVQPGPAKEVSELKTTLKEVERSAKEERKAREEAERILEAEQKAREKAEERANRLMEEAKKRPEIKVEPEVKVEAPEAKGGAEPLTVELAPGFNRPKVEKAVLDWFWKGQGKVRATRKQVILTLEVKAE